MIDIFIDIFNTCLREVDDREYCRGVVEAIAELAETRRVAYRGERGVTYVLNLSRGDQPYVKIAVDKRKKGLIVALIGNGYMAFLIYKREGDRFRPIYAELTNSEITAMTNPKFPNEALQTLLRHIPYARFQV
jgi:hypothetical protein